MNAISNIHIYIHKMIKDGPTTRGKHTSNNSGGDAYTLRGGHGGSDRNDGRREVGEGVWVELCTMLGNSLRSREYEISIHVVVQCLHHTNAHSFQAAKQLINIDVFYSNARRPAIIG